MRAFVTACGAAILAAAPARAQTAAPIVHGPPATAAAVLAAERAFEQRSETAGATAAFSEFMDPAESIGIMNGAALHGAQAIAAAQSQIPAGTLKWTAEEVFASTGDMGAVTGRWSFTPRDVPSLVTGRYVTVWRKAPGGAWKAVIDAGVPDS